ncbi:MAG TPA: polysaccharide biosynthesis/export family protein [Anaeromyxobacteraceae bacterium]|nr:polysaccharide biosynthesis/export family protein [Anaeromyxobacteraceae bacterium]
MNRNQPLTLRGMGRSGVGRIVTVLVAVAGALACASVRGPYIPVEDYPSVAPETEYHIATGDLLAVRVWNQDSMSNPHARVRDDGKISLPFLQDVDVAGITPTELSQRLQVKLKAYVVNPVVTVTVEEFRPLHVEVLGEVVHPGQFELDRGAGVLAALAVAGGLTDYAHHDSIFVLRSNGASTGPTRIRFRYASLIAGEKPAASFRLHAGDVVVAE